MAGLEEPGLSRRRKHWHVIGDFDSKPPPCSLHPVVMHPSNALTFSLVVVAHTIRGTRQS